MGYRPILMSFLSFLIKNFRIRPTNEVNSNTVLVQFSTLSTGCGLCGPESASRNTGQLQLCRSQLDAGPVGAAEGAAEGAVGLLLFFALMFLFF